MDLDWGTPVDPEEAASWQQLQKELPTLGKIRLQHWFHCDEPGCCLEIYGFSDVSERAYATVVHLRAVVEAKPYVSLIRAKIKVAPLK